MNFDENLSNASKVSNNGERFLETLPEHAAMAQDHRARYRFAQSTVRPGDWVLDCACGSGYGSAMLATQALSLPRSVLGIDASESAVQYAREHYSGDRTRFEVGSAYDLPVATGSIDLYCSFETIEHVEDPAELLREARRVLKAGGRFIVSTPNRVVTGLASGERPTNPFHLFEWSLLEFDAALRSAFAKIDYFGQRVKSRNKIHPMYLKSKWRRLCGADDIVSMPGLASRLEKFEHPNHWQPINFIAVCSV